jgi:hypothetical protein
MVPLTMAGFLALRDLFPDSPAAHPESGIHRARPRRDEAVANEAPQPIELTCVPVLLVKPSHVRKTIDDERARWIAPFIDGSSSVAHVVAACGLGQVDALVALERLMDEGLLALI